MQHVSQLALASLTLYALIVGIFLGAVYDVFRILRVAFEPSSRLHRIRHGEAAKNVSDAEKTGVTDTVENGTEEGPDSPQRRVRGDVIRFWAIFAEDIIYSLIVAAVLSVMVFHLNSGQPRWFILLGAAIGFALYYHTVGRVVMFFSEYIIFALRTAVGFILYITVRPIMRACMFLLRLAARFLRRRADLRRSRRLYLTALDNAKRGFGMEDALRAASERTGGPKDRQVKI